MAKLAANPQKNKFLPGPQITEQEVTVAATIINGGINTYIDPADIPNEQLQLGKNLRISGDRIGPRDGTSSANFPTPPNTSKILNISLFPRFDGTSEFVRFDNAKIFKKNTTGWTEITGSGFTVETRQRTIGTLDRFFFVTGFDNIKEINLAANTYATLGNAPRYKYICSFFNRIVGANLYDATTPNPVQVGWSGDLNFSVWDSISDISAGNVALVEGEGDFSDPITGLEGFASVMLIPRERSLWIAQKQAVAENPFQYTAAFPKFGCDSPDSISKMRNGIVWYDSRSSQVYAYEIGNNPELIGSFVRRDLKKIIKDNTLIQGSYDPVGNRYHLCIPSTVSSTTRIYVYDFETRAWTYDEKELNYGVYPIDSVIIKAKINNLVGKINGLLGKINSLSGTKVIPSSMIYGSVDGIITQEVDGALTDDGTIFASELISKIFTVQTNVSVNQLFFKFVGLTDGNFSTFFSRNAGQSWELYKTTSFMAGDNKRRRIETFPKHITTSEYSFRIVGNSGKYQLNEFRITGVQTTETRDQ